MRKSVLVKIAILLFGIYGLAFACLLAFRAYLNYKNSEKTLGWRLYKNEQYGFEFRYPDAQGWKITESRGFGTPFSLNIFSNTSTQPLALEVALSIEPGFKTPDELADAFRWDQGFKYETKFRTVELIGTRVTVMELAPAFSVGESTVPQRSWSTPESELFFFQGPASTVFNFTVSAFKRDRDGNVMRDASLVLSTLKFNPGVNGDSWRYWWP